MGIFEEISYLKEQGLDDKEISERLQERGISPKAINDAINQMAIKKAIYSEDKEEALSAKATPSPPFTLAPPQPLYSSKRMEIENSRAEEFYAPPPLMEEGEAQQYGGQYSQEEYYPQEGYGESEGGYDTETFIEIADQVFSEKIKKEKKQIEALNEFATLAETKISNNHERIKRMEAIIDKLQIAILEKIGSYGKSLESIKSEMEMVQDSFEKIIPKLHEIGKHTTEHTHHKHHEPSAKKEHGKKKKISG